MLELIWKGLNSPVLIALLAAAVLWGLNKLYAAKPAWARWEGTIIEAIKAAEKAIPDDTPNRALSRMNSAMRYVLNVYKEMRGRDAKPSEVAALREGINIVHAKLEAGGNLTRADPPDAKT